MIVYQLTVCTRFIIIWFVTKASLQDNSNIGKNWANQPTTKAYISCSFLDSIS